MSFDYVYEDEWKEAGIQREEVENARVLLQAIFSADFIDQEDKRSRLMGRSPITRGYRKHPLLLYLESPFLSNVCNLLHLAHAFSVFKDEPSISEYISRIKRIELFRATLLELEFGAYLFDKGLKPKPSHKIEGGEIDIYIDNVIFGKQLFLECKGYGYKSHPEESRRALMDGLMTCLSDLPPGFIIGFKSYVEINAENLKSIRGKLKSLIVRAPELYASGQTTHDLLFGRMIILHTTNITEEIISKVRAEYNEVVVRANVPQEALKYNIKLIKEGASPENQIKSREGILAMDLPLNRPERKKVDYLGKVKSDIDDKIRQHKSRVEAGEDVVIVLEDIPTEDFMRLKGEVETGLYAKYTSLSILFIGKEKEKKHLAYKVLPVKLTYTAQRLVGQISP